MTDKLINIKTASGILGVSKDTLRNWDSNGKLKSIRTEGNHRRYKMSEVLDILGIKQDSKSRDDKAVIVYCRVSSHDQKKKGDLERQKGRVLEHCIKKRYNVEYILEEVASGMSDKRPKLKKLFQIVREKKVSKVVIEHKDRLTRFMFNILVEFFNSFDVEIECVKVNLNKSFEEELTRDMVSLMASFSAKIYGKRSAENRKRKKNENN